MLCVKMHPNLSELFTETSGIGQNAEISAHIAIGRQRVIRMQRLYFHPILSRLIHSSHRLFSATTIPDLPLLPTLERRLRGDGRVLETIEVLSLLSKYDVGDATGANGKKIRLITARL